MDGINYIELKSVLSEVGYGVVVIILISDITNDFDRLFL